MLYYRTLCIVCLAIPESTVHAPLTAWQLKPRVDEDGVAGGVGGAEDAALLQHHLGVERPPAAGALLG